MKGPRPSKRGRLFPPASPAFHPRKEKADVGRASENADVIRQKIADLQADLETETESLRSKIDPSAESLESISVRPKKKDITVRVFTLAWAPHWKSADGEHTPAWE